MKLLIHCGALILLAGVPASGGCSNQPAGSNDKKDEPKAEKPKGRLVDAGMPANWTKEKQPEREAELAKKREARVVADSRSEQKLYELLKKTESGKTRVVLPDRARFLGFSPGGTVLVQAHDESLQVLDLETGKIVRALKDRLPRGDSAIAVAPGGDFLALGRDGPTREANVWNLQTGAAVATIEHPTCSVLSALGFSPDGKTLAIGGSPKDPSESSPTIVLWDLTAGKKRAELGAFRTLPKEWGSHNQASNLCFSPDGAILASAHVTGLVYLWDARTGKPLREISFLKNTPDGAAPTFASLAFSPDGWTLAVGAYRTHDKLPSFVTVVDLATGKQRTLAEYEGLKFHNLAFTPDGNFLLGGFSKNSEPQVRVWDLQSGKEKKAIDDLWQGRRVAVSPGGILVTTEFNGNLWHLPSLLGK